MGAYLTPETIVSLGQVNVLLCYFSANCTLLNFEFFFAYLVYLVSSFNQEVVDCFRQVFARFLRALNKELASKDVSAAESAGKDNVAELLLGSEVVKERLVEVLHNDINDQTNSHVVILSNFEVCQNARVVVCLVFKHNFNQVASAILDLNWLHCWKISDANWSNTELFACLFNQRNSHIASVVSSDEPKESARL